MLALVLLCNIGAFALKIQ